MPLIHKPRDPNYGVRRVLKRKVVRRKPLYASVLAETKTYIESKRETMSPGQVIDAAIKFYAECRELSEMLTKEGESSKRQVLNTTVSQETLAYVQFMLSAMTAGELIDVAIKLYKEMNETDKSKAQ